MGTNRELNGLPYPQEIGTVTQVANYAQTLWITMQKDAEHVQNGIVDLTNTLIGQ